MQNYIDLTGEAIKQAMEEVTESIKNNPLMHYETGQVAMIAKLMPSLLLNQAVMIERLGELIGLLVEDENEEDIDDTEEEDFEEDD